MSNKFALKLIAACALATGTTGLFAQHVHGAADNPYAGQQTRDIKALSSTQTEDLLAGKGMEQARAAELNGYPGPMHTLELGQQLELTATQRAASEQLMLKHKAEARALGEQLVEAERELDKAFAARRIDDAQLAAQTLRIGQLQAALRNSHLQTHLQQTRLLTPHQIKHYAQLRGYAGSAGASSTSKHQH
ncbi:MAG TPA: hypothetical protein VE934_06670 [Polaromonas sp.]|uniref:Spy/CpxP family protein refolding chaperone n=1 Tax=Polaromonas sp. TaxID=1869339 RepID=UPI002D60FC60|nr:hypothetical protein [Polaromonas sp.]HYW56623.1 hypothetical protein [Polaromonas sp.]